MQAIICDHCGEIITGTQYTVEKAIAGQEIMSYGVPKFPADLHARCLLAFAQEIARAQSS